MAALLVVATLSAGGARAAAPGPASTAGLARARVCYEALDYECAARELAALREGLPAADPAEAVAILALSAEVALSTGRRAEAIDALAALLAREPSWEPPAGAWPATWRSALAEARGRLPDRDAPALAGEVPRARAGVALPIELAVTDRAGVARVILHVLRPGAAPGDTLSFAMEPRGAGRYGATVPAELVTGPALLMWAEAWDRLDNGPGTWGSREAPRRVEVVAAPDDASVTSEWWFWTAIGAAVVGGVVLAVALSAGDDATPSTSGPGDAHVIVEFP